MSELVAHISGTAHRHGSIGIADLQSPVLPAPVKATHLHFIVWAFLAYVPETGNCMDNVTLDLIAGMMEEALKKAESIIPERLYRVHSVIEHFNGACK